MVYKIAEAKESREGSLLDRFNKGLKEVPLLIPSEKIVVCKNLQYKIGLEIIRLALSDATLTEEQIEVDESGVLLLGRQGSSIKIDKEEIIGRFNDYFTSTLDYIRQPQPYRFIGSYGTLLINHDGTVNEKSDLGDWLNDIHKVDVEELIYYNSLLGIEGLCNGDVLDFGYWDKKGIYHRPCFDWRYYTFNGMLSGDKLDDVISKSLLWLFKNRACF